MIDVRQILALHETTVRLWHTQEIVNPYHDFAYQVCEQHKYNYLLWHEEDVARSRDVTDQRIAEVKRAIDGYNQKRNDWIERLDDNLKRMLDERGLRVAPGAKHNSETPGAIIDKLSIMSLRLYHMHEQVERTDASPEHTAKVRDRLEILHAQYDDLSDALVDLVVDLAQGRKRLKLYRQFKMYNDPTLNPYLYQAKESRQAA
ncbi:MAG: DUF4254 domain-containing protein [Pirellulales bacterium]